MVNDTEPLCQEGLALKERRTPSEEFSTLNCLWLWWREGVSQSIIGVLLGVQRTC